MTTLGEMVDRGDPIAEVFEEIRKLCEVRGWIPVGFRRIELPDGFVVTVNGTNETRRDDEGLEIPPFHCSAHLDGLPCGLFTLVDGTFIGETSEDRLIASIRAAREKAEARP